MVRTRLWIAGVAHRRREAAKRHAILALPIVEQFKRLAVAIRLVGIEIDTQSVAQGGSGRRCAVVAVVGHVVTIEVGLTCVAYEIAVAVFLSRVRHRRAIVTGCGNAIAIDVQVAFESADHRGQTRGWSHSTADTSFDVAERRADRDAVVVRRTGADATPCPRIALIE
jgi:hypothetical protein